MSGHQPFPARAPTSTGMTDPRESARDRQRVRADHVEAILDGVREVVLNELTEEAGTAAEADDQRELDRLADVERRE